MGIRKKKIRSEDGKCLSRLLLFMKVVTPRVELIRIGSTGYVEQFDTQSAQLTIRETCMFSAKLRLESASDQVTPESTAKFVDQTLRMLELSKIADLQVGNDELGGLSFEQRKRLSIAVELVSNPSIIFLDGKWMSSSEQD